MVLNAAVQMLREAEELKQNILKFKSETSMLQERNLWSLQQQLQKIYQKVLVLDLDYALDKKVEQDLWNIGFKQQIEALQAISKDRKNPLRSEGAAMLSWVLQAAAGFYLCLLHQICTAFKLDLPFRRRASLLGWVEGWSPAPAPAGPKLPPPAAARYICQHCLVHLGDLARYRQQPRVAYTFYRHALVVSPHSGQPYNQLALLARRRGRRLGAIYWHVRAILVRAPFPPAPINLARTLQDAAGQVAPPAPALLPGRATSAPAFAPPRDAHAYVTLLIRAVRDIHTGERLEAADQLVETLNTSLTSLVATDSFESMTLIKMVCVIIWLVHTTTDELTATEQALSESESTAATLSHTLAVGTLLALLLPSHTAESPLSRALPALKVCLEWVVQYPQLVQSAPFAARPQLWHALAHTLNKLPSEDCDKYDAVPLPEDEELHGFQPLERSMEHLEFCHHAAWDTYGRSVPDVEEEKPLDQDVPHPSVVSPDCLSNDPELEARVRANRLVALGSRLAAIAPEHFSVSVEDNTATFTALCRGGELTRVDASRRASLDAPPPVVISEADFREKVRDQRVGILKPQGSLERAREERAMATVGDQELEDAAAKECADDKRDGRRARVNIAMAAILRKQEESCKQVKFKTPPPVAEETDPDANKDAAVDTSLLERPKTMQPKPQKSLAQIPVGRKTGGILALKDKSGYPHLVDIPPEPKPKEKQLEKDPKVIQPPTQKNQGKWNQFEQRAGQRNYGLQSAGISYNPQYSPQANIRLPVVNPKEIDVRSAALQKQNARADSRDKGYMSNDKRQFLNDLPPRFANQRWAQEEENKFRDDDFRVQNVPLDASLFNQPPNWLGMPPPLLPSQLASIQPPLMSQMGQMPSQRPGQMGQMSHPNQMQYPPPMSNLIPNFWKSDYPQTSNANLTQFYPSTFGQLTQIPQTRKPDQNFIRPTAIGQMPRHISPPGYSMPGLGFFDQYNPIQQARNYLDEGSLQSNRSFLEEKTYQPLDMGRHGPLDLSGPLPGYERRMEDRLQEVQETPSSLDLAMPTEEPVAVGRDSPAEDPGTYSLFSGAPGAVSWGNVTQNQPGSPDWMTPPYEPWQPFSLHLPLPVDTPSSPPSTRSARAGIVSITAVKPPHPYFRPF
ncbi:nonsense-mediated mRNA decay factor SMG7-like isoform X1 [Cydia splendana]|uniref:nonsense-mediated mRNA decay factor SMG7-like isoform X1 n=1 Tax=Cydia splendana TaxID=1100963 RepID=UPI0028F49D91